MPLSYEQALAYWFGRINYEQKPPNPDDLKLDRMQALLRSLGDPQERFRIVHVAGSKGKGSTSAMLAAILGQAGYRVGLFTSPHLTRVEERIQVDGASISAAELTALLEEVQDLERRAGGRGPGTHASRAVATFFEVATALGFLHFARRRVDVAVVEVGLGGRFDSTNVCRPLVSLITSISYDHTQLLGDRLASIAREKAGIIKPGRPIVSGATDPEAAAAIAAVSRQRAAPLWQLGADFDFTYQPGQVGPDSARKPRVRISTGGKQWPEMELNLLGQHQAANAAVAVACVDRLRQIGLQVPDAAVRAGLAGVQWPARLEVVGRHPLVVLDCAHNVASAQALVDTLQVSLPPTRRLLVLACAGDKDLRGIVRVLGPHFAQVFLTRIASPRAAAPEHLAELWKQASHAQCKVVPTPAQAWQAARSSAAAGDLICITGSVFLAGELRPIVGALPPVAAKRDAV